MQQVSALGWPVSLACKTELALADPLCNSMYARAFLSIPFITRMSAPTLRPWYYGIVPQVTNVVLVADLGTQLDLRKVTVTTQNSEYHPHKAGGAAWHVLSTRLATVGAMGGPCLLQ